MAEEQQEDQYKRRRPRFAVNKYQLMNLHDPVPLTLTFQEAPVFSIFRQ